MLRGSATHHSEARTRNHAGVKVIFLQPRRNIVDIMLSLLPHIFKSPVQALIIHRYLQIYAIRPSNHCIS